jgi:hypothetical protein
MEPKETLEIYICNSIFNWMRGTATLIRPVCTNMLQYLIQTFPEAEFFEVSGHNLESSPDLRFLYGFLKPYGRGYGFLSGFPSFSFTVYSNALKKL